MNTAQLESIFLKIGGKFRGVFTNRTFRIRNEGYYIVNSISNVDIMGHSLLFYFEENGNVLFFDSLGQHPNVYGGNIFKLYQEFNAKTVVTKRLQSSTSLLCCLLYTSPSPRDKRQSRMPSSA